MRIDKMNKERFTIKALDIYLPNDLIIIIQEYDKTKYNKVMRELNNIFNESFLICQEYHTCGRVYKYPANYDMIFKDHPHLYIYCVQFIKTKGKSKIYVPDF